MDDIRAGRYDGKHVESSAECAGHSPPSAKHPFRVETPTENQSPDGWKEGPDDCPFRGNNWWKPSPSASVPIVSAAWVRSGTLKEAARPMGDGHIVPLFVNP